MSSNEHIQRIRVDVEMIRHALPPEAPDDDWPINDTMCDSILNAAEALKAQNARLAAYASDLERGGVSLGHIKRARARHLHDGDMEGLT